MPIRQPKTPRPFFRATLVAAALAFALLSCLQSAPVGPAESTRADVATPPFYRIEGHAGGTILLMGTIHLGPPGGWTFSPAIVDGLDRADRFILEIDERSLSDDAIGSLLAQLVIIQPPQTLPDLLSPETLQLLDEKDAVLTEMGMPEGARNWRKPWFIVLSLVESISSQSGFDSTASVESTILEAAGTRPLIGLETFAEQLGFFDDLAPELQDALLQDTLLGLDSAAEELRALVHAWRTGNAADLETLGRDGVDELPELDAFYDILIGERNRRWVSVFTALLEDPERHGETIFVGVGALHLFGDDGLIQLIGDAGYEVFPLEQSVSPHE